MPSPRNPLSRLSARALIAALVFASLPAELFASRELPPRLPTSLPVPASASCRMDPLHGPIHADGIGSIRRLTDEAGNITDGYTYSAFGELLSHTGTDPQPYAFTGEPLDPNSGWQYHRARWMDPRTGRFAGMDPFEGRSADPASLHRYVYAAASPASVMDPSGLVTATVLGTAIHQHIRNMYPNQGALLTGMIPSFFEVLFPDIADGSTKEVMEVKPLSRYGLTGWDQLRGYITTLNYVGRLFPTAVGTGWHEGSWSPLPGPYVEPSTGTPYLVVGNAAGVIFYVVPPVRSRERVLERVRLRVPDFGRAVQNSVERMVQLAFELEHLTISDEVVRGVSIAAAAAVTTGVLIATMAPMTSFTARFGF